MTNHDRFASTFRDRTGRTFSTAEIVKVMLAESDIQLGSILPNDHGEGNNARTFSLGTDRQICDRVQRGTYRMRDYPTQKASWFRFIVETIMRRMRAVTPGLPRWVSVVLCRVEIIPPRRTLDLYFALEP